MNAISSDQSVKYQKQ